MSSRRPYGSRNRGQGGHRGEEHGEGPSRGYYQQRPRREGEGARGEQRSSGFGQRRDRGGDNRQGFVPRGQGFTRGRGRPISPPIVELEPPPSEYEIVSSRTLGTVNISKEIELVEKLSGLKINHKLTFAPKKVPGTQCRDRMVFLTNLFKLSFNDEKTMIFHHYDIVVEPQSDSGDEPNLPGPRRRSRKLAKEVTKEVVNKFGKKRNIFPVYDYGRNMFTDKDLGIGSEEMRFEVELVKDKKTCTYIIEIKKVCEIIIEPGQTRYPSDALQLMNIILSYGISHYYIPVGPRLYDLSRQCKELPQGKKLVYGIYKSTRNTETGMMVNINDVAGVFYEGGPLINILSKFLNKTSTDELRNVPSLPKEAIKAFENEIKGLKFTVAHLRYRKPKMTVAGISLKSAKELFFDCDGVRISVAQYFDKKYRKLVYPNFPCIFVKKEKRKDYFPFEVCEILTNQYVTGDLSPKVLTAMSTFSAQKSPVERFKDMMESLKKLNERNQFYNKKFNINLSMKPVTVNARVLHVPQIKYNVPFTPGENCDWYMQTPSKKRFFKANPLVNYVIVNFATDIFKDKWQPFYEAFVDRLKNSAGEIGLEICKPSLVYEKCEFTASEDKFTKIEKFFNHLQNWIQIREIKIQLVICFIPYDDNCYYPIKSIGDRKGIITQCLNAELFRDIQRRTGEPKLLDKAYLTNVLLKINAKIDGVNVIIELPPPYNKETFMFIGVDVTHPSPGAVLNHSIAAAVATYDKTYAKYSSIACVQDREKQEIVKIDKLFKELIDQFRRCNKNMLPSRIVVYRDGVSDSQFAQVMSYEVTHLRDLLNEYYQSSLSLPKLTYIIVQKRHQQRFFTDKFENIPPGSVVDHYITSPYINDFYLCSQNGRLGLSRPAHYSVLYDDSSFEMDYIQNITYKLCFNNARATKSVSIPTPVHYAHLAAFRARRYIAQRIKNTNNEQDDDTQSVRTTGSDDSEEMRRQNTEKLNELNNYIRVPNSIQNLLYYI